ncbi:putative transcription factor bZIP family [Lupinus albus]|uniref:Putative transcription factor bZIP family n=1 Tax=Lupinus albus TaxID=3870 RepID=A0A6A4Q348_LUPAL|nr:putative transcription factor bZIP family [Lupinus albus]
MQLTGFLLILHYFILLNFEGVMDGHGSSFVGKGQLPTTTSEQNTMPGGTYNIISGGQNEVDAPNDPEAQRRARNRNYSKTYRLKKQDHMLKLEDQVKTLNETLSITSSELQYFKEVQSNLEIETNSLMNTLAQISSSFDGDEGPFSPSR